MALKSLLLAALLVAFTAPANALTLAETRAAADARLEVIWPTVRDRVQACVVEGNPRICHTAWSASVLCNTTLADGALCDNTQDDLGRQVTGPCATCYTGEGTFATAGITLPASEKFSFNVNVFRAALGWGVQVVVRLKHEGTTYERGRGAGIAPSFNWREVTAGP